MTKQPYKRDISKSKDLLDDMVLQIAPNHLYNKELSLFTKRK